MSKSEFSNLVKQQLNKEAGSQCSICKCLTTGEKEQIGEAAHIKGAKPAAARYDKNQSDDERSSQKNGIWLCRNCHKKIDSKENLKVYTAEELLRIKKEHHLEIKNNIGKNKINQTIEVAGQHIANPNQAKSATALHIKSPAKNIRITPGTQSIATGNAETLIATLIE